MLLCHGQPFMTLYLEALSSGPCLFLETVTSLRTPFGNIGALIYVSS